MTLQKTVLVGRTRCGKTTLCQALYGLPRSYKKTQGLEVVGTTIDLPGEYMENVRYYGALQVTAANADVVLLVQDCTDGQSLFPPGFAGMFGGKRVLGVVNKTGLGTRTQQKNAALMLKAAGVKRVFYTDALAGTGVKQLQKALGADK